MEDMASFTVYENIASPLPHPLDSGTTIEHDDGVVTVPHNSEQHPGIKTYA